MTPEPHDNEADFEAAKAALERLTPRDRQNLVTEWCRYCGSDDGFKCTCMRDD